MTKKCNFILIVLGLFVYHSNAIAQTELGLMVIGGHIGLVNPNGPIGETITLEASADLGQLTEKLNLDVRLGYWSKSEGVFSLRDFIIGGSVLYAFDTEVAQLHPYAGGGLSLHFFKSEQNFGDGFGVQSFSDTELGIDLRGGAKYSFNEQIDFVGEIIYVLGDAEQFGIKVGALFKLGQ